MTIEIANLLIPMSGSSRSYIQSLDSDQLSELLKSQYGLKKECCDVLKGAVPQFNLYFLKLRILWYIAIAIGMYVASYLYT